MLFTLLSMLGCASHQYDGMAMKDAGDGTNYNINKDTLTVQYQEFQFYPNTTKVLLKCRNVSKQLAIKY